MPGQLWRPQTFCMSRHHCDPCTVGNWNSKWGHFWPQPYGLLSGQWDTGWVCGDTSDTRQAEEEGMQVKCLLVTEAVFEPRSTQTCLKPLDSLTPRSSH